MEIVPLPQKGGCLCGAVRYRLTGAPLLAYACHCHDCQTRSGAAFSLTLVVNTADVAARGELAQTRRTTTSGREVEHGGCPACGVLLFGRAPVAPDYMSLRAGSLDDASWVRPIAQSFVESAIPWAVIPSVRAVPWPEFDFAKLGEEWRASAPRFEARPVRLSRATAADAPAIRDLTRHAYAPWVERLGREPRPMTADYESAVLSHRFDLAHVGDELVALIETVDEGDVLLIENVAVAPEHQGHGLGRRLLAHAETLARDLGRRELRLFTNALLVENIALYERVGYSVVEVEDLGFAQVTHMRKGWV